MSFHEFTEVGAYLALRAATISLRHVGGGGPFAKASRTLPTLNKLTARAWTFTFFNPTPANYQHLSRLPNGLKLLVYQSEICPQTGRLHIQGYARTHESVRLAGAILRIGLGVRIKVLRARGGDDANIKYCSKTESRVPGSRSVLLGEKAEPGCRSDLVAIADAITHHRSPLQVFADYPAGYLRFERSINRTIDLVRPGRDSSVSPRVIVLYGPTRAGKSRFAAERFPDAYWCTTNSDGRLWWTHYQSETDVIIDDYAGELPFRWFLRLLDRWPLFVEAKGTATRLNATTFVITSNLAWDSWYRWEHRDGTPRLTKSALESRITCIIRFRPVLGGVGSVREVVNGQL